MDYSDGQSINRWWNAPKGSADVGKCTVDIVTDLLTVQLPRRQQAQQQMSTYLGCSVGDLGPGFYNTGRLPTDAATINVVRRIVDTAVAKIAAKQRPKAQVLTKGGNYRERLEAKKLSKFLEGQLYEPQGCYPTTWDMTEQLFRDACIWTAGVMKIYADPNKGRIVKERCYPFDILVDDYDAEYGTPQNLFHIYRYDKHVLAARFPKCRGAIMSGAEYPELVTGGDYFRRMDSVAVYEAIRLPPGRKQTSGGKPGELIPGRRVLCVAGGEGEDNVLVDEPWTSEQFPYVFLRWKRNSAGVWGMSLVDEIASSQDMLDEMFAWIQENMELMAGGKIFVSKENQTIEEQIKQNDPHQVIVCNDPNGINFQTPPPINPAVVNWLEVLRGIPYEISGVNEMTSQGKKETGVTAAVAVRTINDLQSELFLPQARAYEQLFVDIARRDLEAAQILADNKVPLESAMPSEGFLDTVDFGEIKLPADKYKVTIQATNSGEDSLASRRQMVTELFQAGTIKNPAVIERLLTTPNLDLEAMSNARQAQFHYMEQLISDFMHFDAETNKEDEIVESPEKYMNLDDAILQMTQAYWEMKKDRAPEENLRLARNWIDQADALIAKRDAPPPAPAGQPGMGAPPPGPGMPMGGEMGPPQMPGVNIPPEMMPAA